MASRSSLRGNSAGRSEWRKAARLLCAASPLSRGSRKCPEGGWRHGYSWLTGSPGSKTWERAGTRTVPAIGSSLVEHEPGTTAWFALKFGPFSFGIFDAFPHDTARQAHLAGR